MVEVCPVRKEGGEMCQGNNCWAGPSFLVPRNPYLEQVHVPCIFGQYAFYMLVLVIYIQVYLSITHTHTHTHTHVIETLLKYYYAPSICSSHFAPTEITAQ